MAKQMVGQAKFQIPGGQATPAPPVGTSLGKLLLERLSDKQFRVWSNRLITVLASYYVGYGLVLLTGIA